MRVFPPHGGDIEIDKSASIRLPPPNLTGGVSLVESIARRRSIRSFSPEPLSRQQLSQILWAAQGITETSWKLRTAPSAGGTYPLEIFIVCGNNGIEETEAGVYHYDIENHALTLHYEGDSRMDVSQVALGEESIYQAPVNIVICAEYERTEAIYGDRAVRYVHMEAGHAGQNIYLQATALGLGTVAIGAFYDEQVRKVLRLDRRYKPLYIMPVGKPP